ncbi:MAG: hypothetical protein WC052_04390 [Patescibacteria group bacterium]
MDHPSLVQYLGSTNTNPHVLATIGDETWTLEMVLAVVSYNPPGLPAYLKKRIMTYIPIRFHSRGIWLTAICKIDDLCDMLPKEFHNQRFYDEAVRITPRLFQSIPLCYRSPQLTSISFIAADNFQKRRYLQHVPPESQTDELVKLALVASAQNVRFIERPSLQQCYDAIERDPRELRNIGDQSDQICRLAIDSANDVADPMILCDVLFMIRRQTDEICLYAIGCLPQAMEFVHEQREGLCLAAFAQLDQTSGDMTGDAGRLLWSVRNQTFDICMVAYSKSPPVFFEIRDPTMRDRVARAVLSRAIIALRGANLSTLLLTEVCEAATPVLFPAPIYCGRTVLTLAQLWRLAKLIRDAA